MESVEFFLIVYGSLGPGGPNHHQLASLDGTWTAGWVTGELVSAGWGAEIGYPALVWSANGPRVPAWLLRSAMLPGAWERLDTLEGAEYRRIVVPFHSEEGVVAQGYLYAAR